MPRVELITHQYDTFMSYNPAAKGYISNYLMSHMLVELHKRGYQITINNGAKSKSPKGDIAILHVDCTIVPDEYMEYALSFPLCINGKVGNISKKLVSQAVVEKGEQWDGPLIVKSNYNCNGNSELLLNKMATQAGATPPFPGLKPMEDYTVYKSIRDLPQDIFDDQNLVVEKFIPEIDSDGYAMRSYIFCGDEEKCARYISKEKIIKGSNFIRKEPSPVPDELRELRKQHGFDYGKFEFVIHGGRAIVIDMNKTLGLPGRIPETIQDTARQFTNGFESMVSKHL